MHCIGHLAAYQLWLNKQAAAYSSSFKQMLDMRENENNTS